MNENNKNEKAKEVYKTLCEAIDSIGWHYNKLEELNVVFFDVSGDDIPMDFMIVVNADVQRITLMSKMPFSMSEDKRVEGAIAATCATNSIIDGCFDYDIKDGSIFFNMTSTYIDCTFGKDRLLYLVNVAANTIDEYNDQFLAINKGTLSIEAFIAQECK